MKISYAPILATAFLAVFILPLSATSESPSSRHILKAKKTISKADMKHMKAVYQLSLNNLPLGKFKFNSYASDTYYKLSASTKLQVLGFLYSWKANIKADGFLEKDQIKPKSFGYTFKDKKTKKQHVAFPQSAEEEFVIKPPLKRSRKRIAFKPEHFENVFDPMSGLVFLTQLKTATPSQDVCNQTIAIFDGKQRYDISLTFKNKKVVNVADNKKRTAYVCTLMYTPVAGHKPNNKINKFYVGTKTMEVFLVPFPRAQMYVPVKINIPTPIGWASIVASKFIFKDAKKKQITLVN